MNQFNDVNATIPLPYNSSSTIMTTSNNNTENNDNMNVDYIPLLNINNNITSNISNHSIQIEPFNDIIIDEK